MAQTGVRDIFACEDDSREADERGRTEAGVLCVLCVSVFRPWDIVGGDISIYTLPITNRLVVKLLGNTNMPLDTHPLLPNMGTPYMQFHCLRVSWSACAVIIRLCTLGRSAALSALVRCSYHHVQQADPRPQNIFSQLAWFGWLAICHPLGERWHVWRSVEIKTADTARRGLGGCTSGGGGREAEAEAADGRRQRARRGGR